MLGTPFIAGTLDFSQFGCPEELNVVSRHATYFDLSCSSVGAVGQGDGPRPVDVVLF